MTNRTQCPYCGGLLVLKRKAPTPDIKAKPMWKRELQWMVGKGWLFKGTLKDDSWKCGNLKWFVEDGLVECHPKNGFRATSKASDYLGSSQKDIA